MSDETTEGVVTHPITDFIERYGAGVIAVVENEGDDESAPEDQVAVAVVAQTEDGPEPYPVRLRVQDDDSWADAYLGVDAAKSLMDALRLAIDRARVQGR